MSYSNAEASSSSSSSSYRRPAFPHAASDNNDPFSPFSSPSPHQGSFAHQQQGLEILAPVPSYPQPPPRDIYGVNEHGRLSPYGSTSRRGSDAGSISGRSTPTGETKKPRRNSFLASLTSTSALEPSTSNLPPLSTHYVPTKFTAPRQRKGMKVGGGRAAFGREAGRMGTEAEQDEDGGVVVVAQGQKVKKVAVPRGRWNGFKWTLFLANLLVGIC